MSIKSKLFSSTLLTTILASSALFVNTNLVHADTVPDNNANSININIPKINVNIDNTNSTKTSDTSTTPTKTKGTDVQAKRDKVVNQAAKEIGKPYVWGATGPNSFDCSGLTQYTYRHAINKALPRTTYTQVHMGKRVSLSHLKKGDLLFWGPKNAPYHVGIYAGHGTYIHAPQPGQNVRRQALSSYFYPSCAKRIIK